MADADKPGARLVIQSAPDPRLEALNERIAELVAEVLFEQLVKKALDNKVNQSKILVDGQEAQQAHDR
jgi:hypothetical protein